MENRERKFRERTLRLREAEHKIIDINGVTLHAAQAGQQDGPLLILLHGFRDFWYGWRKQIPALAEVGFRVWALDQRGYNLSEKPRSVQSYGLNALTLDVVGLMEAAGVERACVAGHDWGAAVAWWLGIHYADRLEKMAILNAPHPAIFLPFLRSHPEQILKSWYMYFFRYRICPSSSLEKRVASLCAPAASQARSATLI